MKINLRDTIGILFILGGGILILETLNIFSGNVENLVWFIIFGSLGGLFLSKYLKHRQKWGWIFPGVIFLSIAFSNLLELVLRSGGLYSDFIILSGIGLSFVLVYINERINWWAIIPGGLLISLGAGEVIGIITPELANSGSILFLGLGCTFLILYLLPTQYGRLTWALIPSIILLALGSVLAFSGNIAISGFIGPAIIIILGIIVLYFSIRK